MNAFVTVGRDSALAAAAAADAARAAGQAGALTGMPFAHKDVFVTEGVLTTCGSKMLANFVGPYDAHVVSQLQPGRPGDAGQDQYGRVRHGLVQ